MLLTPMIFFIYDKFLVPPKNEALKQTKNNIDEEI
jgi:hypothetical protein